MLACTAIFAAMASHRVAVAVLAAPVPAGFPSPAEDYVEGKLDLNEHLIRRPAATFIVRVEGDSMAGAGIFSGDLLVVDRSIEARPDSIVVAAEDAIWGVVSSSIRRFDRR